VESGGIKFGRKACYFFSFQCLLFQRNLGILELRPECSAEFAGTECNGIQLFVCLFVCFTPVTKQTTNQTLCDMVSFHHPPPPPLLPPHQRRPMTALSPRRHQWTTIKDDCSRPPRNDNKPPKMNMNNGQHTKMAATPKKRTTAHYHHPPQPTNDSQCPRMDTGDTDRRQGTRMTMRDKGQWQQWLSSLLSFYNSYCKYPLPLSSLSTNATPPPSTAHLVTPPHWEGPPTCQQPRYHMKRNDARQQWHWRTMHSDGQRQLKTNSDRWPMTTRTTNIERPAAPPTNDEECPAPPTCLHKHHHHPPTPTTNGHEQPPTNRTTTINQWRWGAQTTTTTTIQQHPPRMAPPPSTNGEEGQPPQPMNGNEGLPVFAPPPSF